METVESTTLKKVPEEALAEKETQAAEEAEAVVVLIQVVRKVRSRDICVLLLRCYFDQMSHK